MNYDLQGSLDYYFVTAYFFTYFYLWVGFMMKVVHNDEYLLSSAQYKANLEPSVRNPKTRLDPNEMFRDSKQGILTSTMPPI